MQTLVQDLRHAFRVGIKNRNFTAVALLTLALGIGATSAIFSVINAVLIQPLPFHDSDRLVTIWERDSTQGYDQHMPAKGNFLDWREQSQSFQGMAIFQSNVSFAWSRKTESERVIGAKVSANLFEVLGVAPAVGRTFTHSEETEARPTVAMISHDLWKRRFHADPNVMGEAVLLDGQAFTIVGIMPRWFRFPGMTGVLTGNVFNEPADVWVPIPLDGEARLERGSHYAQVIARLKAGVTLAEAAAEMDAIQGRLEAEHRPSYMGTGTTLVPLAAQSVANVRLGLLITLGAGILVLVIACGNLANLLLARAVSRQKEMALRLALGAARSRLVRQLLTENLLLGLGGAVLGVLLGHFCLGFLLRLVPGEVSAATPGWSEIRLDAQVMGFTLIVSFVTTLLFGLAPALQATRTNLQTPLLTGSRGSSGGRTHRLANTLVVGQVALTLVLLAASGLLIQTFARLQRVDTGFEPHRVLAVQMELPNTFYPEDREKADFYARLLDRIQALHGVELVGMTVLVPFGGDGPFNCTIEVEGRSENDAGKVFVASWRAATPGYFKTMGIRLDGGRVFSELDREWTQPVMVVNQAFVREFLPNQNPIGKRVSGFSDHQWTIVGVVRDFKQRALDQEVRPEMFTPQAQLPWQLDGDLRSEVLYGVRTLVVRAQADPMALVPTLRSEVRALDPRVPITKVHTMRTLVSNSVAHPRFRMVLFTAFSGLALILAAVGTYGVLSYSVSQRTHEIGIRMAVGAGPRDVMRLVLREGMQVAALGLGFGLIGCLMIGRVMRSLLFGVQPSDPINLSVMTLLLGLVAFFACWIPARRVTRVDPLTALRDE